MSLIDRAKNIIVTPKTEWEVIAGEEPNTGQIVTGYVIPLALIPAVASFIGYGLIGTNLPFVGHIASVSFGIGQAVISLLTSIIGVFLSSFIISALAPSFASVKDNGRAMQLVAYSYTPVWVSGIFAIYPPISFLMILGLYGLYLLYLGFPHTMKTPQDKVVVYMIVSIIVIAIVYFIIGALLTVIMGLFGLGAASMMM